MMRGRRRRDAVPRPAAEAVVQACLGRAEARVTLARLRDSDDKVRDWPELVAVIAARAYLGAEVMQDLLAEVDRLRAREEELEGALRQVEFYPYDVRMSAEQDLAQVKEIARAALAGEQT